VDRNISVPSRKIAATLGVDFEVFLAWRLRAGNLSLFSEPPEPKASRIVAERMSAVE
jgi:hypothetical protein